MRSPTPAHPLGLALVCLCLLLGPTLAGCRPAESAVWQPVSDGIERQSDVVFVSISRPDPQTLFLSTYEPGGLYRSTDGPKSWKRSSEGLEGVTALSLALSPLDDQLILEGTVCGGYESTDGGQTSVSLPVLPTTWVYALAWAPHGSVVYAGTEGLGVYLSTDEARCEAANWRPARAQLAAESRTIGALETTQPISTCTRWVSPSSSRGTAISGNSSPSSSTRFTPWFRPRGFCTEIRYEVSPLWY
jgi:photosystem II stability/assembly factor-like uncharacterized protein